LVMAREDAVIRIVTEGEERLSRVQNSLRGLQGVLDRLNSTPLALDDERMRRIVNITDEAGNKIANAQNLISAAMSRIARYANEQANLNDIQRNTIAGLKEQAAAFGQVASNAKIGEQVFRDAIVARERLLGKATRGDQERLKVLKEYYETERLVSRGGQERSVNLGLEELTRQQRIAFGTGSLASLKAFRSELERVLELVGPASPIKAGVTDILSQTQARIESLAPAKTPAPVKRAILASSLEDPVSVQKKRFEFYERQELVFRKIERVAQNINKVTLDEISRASLLLKLDEARLRAREGGLAFARETAKEIDRETRDLVKAHYAQKRAADQQFLTTSYMENQYEIGQKIKQQAADKIYTENRLAGIFDRQLTKLKTIQTEYTTAGLKGVKTGDTRQTLEQEISQLESGTIQPSLRNVDILGERIKRYEGILRSARALQALEKAIEAQGEVSTNQTEDKARIELRRLNLLNAATNLEGRMIGLGGKGVQLSSERAQLEALVLEIQNAQNTATQRGNIELAQRLSVLRNFVRTQEVANATEQGAGQTKMLGGVRAKFNEMFPKGPGGRRQVTEQGFENIALGAGFPLMFGGGPGTVAGGLLGSFVGSGFGGQILGGAIGQIIDQAVISVKNLNDAFLTAGDSYSQLRQTGLQFTAELERQVMAAKSIGDFERARQIQAGPMLQMGDVGGIGVSGTAAAVGVLQNAWNGVYKTVALTVGILGSPFIALLGLILRIVQGIFGVVNLVLTGLGTLILKIPGLKKMIDDSNESILDGNAAYQDQLAELNKQSDELSRILSTKSKIFQITAGTVGTSKENFEIEKRRGEQIQRQADLEAKIQEIRRKAPLTKGGEAKANEIIAKERTKFLMEEFSIAANNAQSLFQEVQSHNREIALAKIDLEKQVRDMQRESAEQQRAINLETARKVEDMMLDRQGKELDFIKRRRDLEIDAAKVAAQEASSQRQFASILAGTSAQDSLLNTTLDALDAWKIGRDQVENDARDKQMKLQLDLKRMDIEMQRYREDSALRIAKINFDSQRKIADMNQRINRQNDEVERKRFSMRIEAAKAEIITIQSQAAADKAKVLLFAGTNTIASQLQADQLNMAMDIADLVRGNASKLLQILGAIRPAAPIANVGQLPTLTMDTGAATAQYEQTRQMVNQNEQQLAANQKELDLRKNNLELGEKIRNNAAEYVKTLNQANDENSKSLRIQDMYRNNLARGILPDLAEQLAQQDDLFNAQAKSFRETYNALVKFNEIAKDPAITKIIADLKEVGGAMATAYDTMQAATEARFSPKARIADARMRIRESVLELQDPTNQFIMAMDAVAKIEEDLYRLTNPVYQLVDAANAMGSAFSNSFKGVISGSMSAQEALANFFQRTADHFLDMAAQILTQQVVLKLIGFGLNILNPFSSSVNLGGGFAGAEAIGAAGARAMGGPVTGGLPYLVGEKGPELFVPGSSGKIVPNHQLGSGDISVMVNVDASGSSVQGDDQKSSELGRVIATAVQQELLKQKRPGGILTR
jgi:hypothetical protein